LIVLRAPGKAGSPSALSFLADSRGGAFGRASGRRIERGTSRWFAEVVDGEA